MSMLQNYCLFQLAFCLFLSFNGDLVSAQQRNTRKLGVCSEIGFECTFNSDCCVSEETDESINCISRRCTASSTTALPNTLSTKPTSNSSIPFRVASSYEINDATTTTTVRTPVIHTNHPYSKNNMNDFRNHPNFYLLPNTTDCGFSTTNEYPRAGRRFRRLVGGKLAKRGQFPWMIQIVKLNVSENKQIFRCGASLINSRYVLTAAHCVSRVAAGGALTVVNLGAYDFQYTSPELPSCSDPQEYSNRSRGCSEEINEIIAHEDYVSGTSENDVALIRLENPVDFKELPTIKPICLPYKKDLLAESKEPIQVSGWGRIDAYYDSVVLYSKYLNTLNVRLVPREYCDFFYSVNHGYLGESRICGIGANEKSPCNGDSGSPVSQEITIPEGSGEKRSFQLGIISVGGALNCARHGQPFVMSNVVEYMPWILNNIKP